MKFKYFNKKTLDKNACLLHWHDRRKWLPTLLVVTFIFGYIAILIVYAKRASTTLRVYGMVKADECQIDYVGHKSGSLKTLLCCEEWLGVICRGYNYMDCPSISVRYKLPNEDFERAGYLNHWNPEKLLKRYASNSHCMIVPITCPNDGDRWLYEMEKVQKDYSLHQQLTCHVYSDMPGRPLLVVANLFPNVPSAFMVFVLPPFVIVGALAVCIAVKPIDETVSTPSSPEPESKALVQSTLSNTDKSISTASK